MNEEAMWHALKYITAFCLLMGGAVTFLYSNFATAGDVEAIADEVRAIEVRLIKQDMREIRRELKMNHLDTEVKIFLTEQLAEAVTELCILQPNDKECR